MRLRTLIGIVVALGVAITVAYLATENEDLLAQRFQIGAGASLAVWVLLLIVFLLGFVPAVSLLTAQSLKRDLARRRQRRRSRETRSLESSIRRATDYEADGLWGKAAAEHEAVLAERPEDFATLLAYGAVLRRQGRPGEALEVHRRASVLYPRSVAVLYELAADYEVNGEEEVARQIRDRILRDFQGRGLRVLRRLRGEAIARRDWAEARRLHERIESMLAESGADADPAPEAGVTTGLAYQRGIELAESERLDEAAGVFAEILERQPDFLPAAIMLGEVEVERGDGAAAVAVWLRGFESSGSPIFLQRIEDHYIERGQPVEAIETLHELAGRTSEDFLPRFFLGRLYARLEMHEEALRILGELKERIGRAPGFRRLMARIHERRGEMGKAVEMLSACLDEAGVASGEYLCRICGARYRDWLDRCECCGAWGSVDLDIEEEGASAAAESGRREASEVFHGEFRRPRDEGSGS